MANQWIIPCNLSFFDIISHFEENDEMLWRATSATAEGDIVYLYVCRPYSRIMYRCHVVATNIDNHEIEASPYAQILAPSKNRRNYIRIKKDYPIADDRLSFDELKLHGLASVQSQMRLSPDLSNHIGKIISKLGGE